MDLAVFEGKRVRSVEHKGELYFSIIDIIEVLTDSPQPSRYWNELRERLFQESGGSQLFAFTEKLKMPSLDGKKRATDCANTEGVLRIIQSVPSLKAEPFKVWMASLGKQAIEEMNDPELGYEHLYRLYEAKGYPAEWIKSRLKSIEVRKELTNEWKKRDVKEGQEYSILTAEIAKNTFGITPTEHKKVKGLDKENLRDHMTNIELIFTMLGEESTRIIAVKDDAQGFEENHDAARRGGAVAKNARLRLEKESGEKVVSNKNFLEKPSSEPLPETGENTDIQ